MKVATLRLDETTAAVRIHGEHAVEIPGAPDVGALLQQENWQQVAAAASGRKYALSALPQGCWAPVVPHPGKIFCVGLNYRRHIEETGREAPEFPTLFPKWTETLVGAEDDVILPPGAEDTVDWEGELAVVIGTSVRHADLRAAEDAIAGYAVLNDVSMREWQHRTTQWLQGKAFEGTTPFGPYLATPDEMPSGAEIRTLVNGEVMQQADTEDLVFGPVTLVSYISQIITLNPGDVIATGTPGGIGHVRTPPSYLRGGDRLHTEITGLGTQDVMIVDPR